MTHPSTAMQLAIAAYQGIHDKTGDPLLAHALRVAARVAGHGPDALVVALLHDAVEDSDLSLDTIEVAFGAAIRDDIDALTHRVEQGETYEAYLARVKARGGTALLVKLADNADNADERRLGLLAEIDPKHANRLRDKYFAARILLTTP